MPNKVGNLIDKLITTDMSMWTAQEWLYYVRKLSLEEFKAHYFADEAAVALFWRRFKQACDLNLLRNQLIDDVDESLLLLLKGV